MSMNGDLERQIRPSGSERQLGPQQIILELQGPKGKGGGEGREMADEQ